MNLTKNISLKEVVSKDIYNKLGLSSCKLIDMRVVNMAQSIRDHFNSPIIINNWHSEGIFNDRGFRGKDVPLSLSGEFSQHRFGRALDFHVLNYPIEEVRNTIISERDRLFGDIMAIEMNVNWIHIDVRYRKDGDLLKFYPK
jgi:hypothetical protein